MRQDVMVWAVSVIYIGAIMGGMFWWGGAKDWHAQKPINSPNPERFWPKPDRYCNVTDSYADISPIRGVSKDCYSKWYYWQLPGDEATMGTRAFVWCLYVAHQLAHWALIWTAQSDRENILSRKEELYSDKMRWYNWAMVGVTYLFHLLHLVQTHITYDATAKDVAIQSSQASVIMMLVFVMCLEYKNRGMFLGWPNQYSDDWLAQRIKLSELPFHYVRKYHGYAFSWAVIYTFWYHPMENTFGHLFGFMHTFFVMIQGSFIYQKIHLNRYWRLLLESWVWFHGFSVAVMVATGEWWTESAPYIFGYGFGTLLFITQLYGLPFWQKINPYWRILPAAAWLTFAVTVVLATPSIPNKNLGLGLGSIPAGQWACAFAAWLILLILRKIMPEKVTTRGPVVHGLITCIIYAIFVIVAWSFQKFADSMDIPFMIGTYVLVFLNIIGCAISWFCMPKPHHFNENAVHSNQVAAERTSKTSDM